MYFIMLLLVVSPIIIWFICKFIHKLKHGEQINSEVTFSLNVEIQKSKVFINLMRLYSWHNIFV